MNCEPRDNHFEAFQWTGDPDQKEDPVWIVNAIKSNRVQFFYGNCRCQMVIGNPDGTRFIAEIGDFIIHTGDNVMLPLDAEIFTQLFREEHR